MLTSLATSSQSSSHMNVMQNLKIRDIGAEGMIDSDLMKTE